MKQRLGKFERQLFAFTQLRGLRLIRTGDLTRPLRLTSQQERELLSRLARAGMIARVRRGLYLVPPRLPLGAKWTPDEAEAIHALMEDRQAKYQICGPNAFYRYGFDNQLPARVYAYNNRVSGDRLVGAVALTLIKVADSRLGRTESVLFPSGVEASYSSRVRTLVDAVCDWSRFASLPRAYEWIRADLQTERVTAADLVETALAFGNLGAVRRIGLTLERAGVADDLLRRMERRLRKSTSVIPWIPTYPKRGATSRRWGVVINDWG